MKFYLIDFENVGLKGLKGAEQLTDTDVVHLFSTKNAAKIPTAELAKFKEHLPMFHEVPAGKSQSLDMHLVSFLGWLMRDKGLDQEYIIISNDTDYDNIIKFWREEKGLKLSRQDSLVKVKEKKKAAEKKEPVDDKTALNAEVQKVAGKAGFNQKECSKIAKIVAQHYKDEDILTFVHNELRTEFGEEKYLKIYNTLKPIISKKKKAAATAKQKNTGCETTTINCSIQKTLSKAKYDTTVISKVASLVSKHHKDGKQVIYRSIIKEYGAETGLKIYNEIKPLLK